MPLSSPWPGSCQRDSVPWRGWPCLPAHRGAAESQDQHQRQHQHTLRIVLEYPYQCSTLRQYLVLVLKGRAPASTSASAPISASSATSTHVPLVLCSRTFTQPCTATATRDGSRIADGTIALPRYRPCSHAALGAWQDLALGRKVARHGTTRPEFPGSWEQV